MKIPKYVEGLLEQRLELANKLLYVDELITHWLHDNLIHPDWEDYNRGKNILIDPECSIDRIRESIEEA